jgi:hypothetical protein
MAKQYSTTLRNAWLDTYESTIGTSPKLRVCTGALPATCATAQSGTQLAELTLPSDWQGAPSSGTSALAGTWSGTVASDGTAGYYRLLSSGGTVHEQGLVTQAFTLSTSATTAANSNVLTFAATTGVSAGMSVSGTGIPDGTTVLAVNSTTVTLSNVSTTGVGSAVAVYFGSTDGDMWLTNPVLTAGQTLSFTAHNFTAPGA